MGLVILVLGILAAVLWGSADFVAALSARRIGTFRTALVSQVVGAGVLAIFGALAYAHVPLHLQLIGPAALAGVLTGLLAAGAYFAFYGGLSLGPISIVSPVNASYGVITLILSVIFLGERLSAAQFVAISGIIIGVALAATDLTELRKVLPGGAHKTLITPGVRAALAAMTAFGLLLFGIGAASTVFGWFLPVFWTRFFAALTLLLVLAWERVRHQRHDLTEDASVSTNLPSSQHNLVLPRKRSTRHWSRRSRSEYPIARARVITSALPPMVKEVARRTLGARTFFSSHRWWMLAALVGTVDTAGFLAYSIDTQIAPTALAAVISSTYTLIPVALGVAVFRERPAHNQVIGVALVILGLAALSLAPVRS